jgi:serine/threonine protein kinase
VLHQIGVGALGPVFRTYEPTRDRLVAVKVFRLDVTPEQAAALADELTRATEAGLFHPSIVEPVGAGIEGTVAYRAEEYVAAESLDIAMRHYAPATMDKALPFISQLASAIDFARAAGVGHGALHPRDIFVTPDEARATGFGVVDALERLGLRAPVRRPYSPPERIAGEPWNTPADVFSLGAISFELLTGRRPSGLGDQMGPLTGASLGPHAEAVRGVLARAMHDLPAERYATAGAFASALAAAAGVDEPVGQPIQPAASQTPTTQPTAAAVVDVADSWSDADMVGSGTPAESAPGPASDQPRQESEPDGSGASAIDHLAAESNLDGPGVSAREVARKVIAARKRQNRSKPPAQPDPVADQDVQPRDPVPDQTLALDPEPPPSAPSPAAEHSAGEATVSPELVLSPEPLLSSEPLLDAEPFLTEPFSKTEPFSQDHDAEPASAPASEDPTTSDVVTGPPAFAVDELSTAHEGESAAEQGATTLGLGAVAYGAIESTRPETLVDAPLSRDSVERVVAVDEFRARDSSAAKSDRAWARSPDRAPQEQIFVPKASPIDPIDAGIPLLPVDEAKADRVRMPMLPVAVGVMVGVVLGYGGGYVVGSREGAQRQQAQATTEQAAAEQAGAASAPRAPDASSQAPGQGFTEQAVDQPPAPPSGAPTETPASAATTRTPPAPPARRTGRIVVTSRPPKAAVTVNGNWIGRTPLTLEDYPFGKYVVRVVQPDYDVAREEFELSAASATKTIDVTLKRVPSGRAPVATSGASKSETPAGTGAATTGELFIDSRPQGARVLVDGRDVGVTPLRLPGQAVGEHTVRLELADHQAWTATARVGAGERARVTGSLERIR